MKECYQIIKPCNDGLPPPFQVFCSECGEEWSFTPKYCPECGAKVISKTAYENMQCKDCFYATYLGQCLYYYKYTLLDMPACKYFIPAPIIDKKNITDVKNNNRQL